MKSNWPILAVLLLLGILRVVSASSTNADAAGVPLATGAYRPHSLYGVLGGALIVLLAILCFRKALRLWKR